MRLLLTCLLSLGLALPLYAQSADSIAQRASAAAYYQGKDGRAAVAMTITDAQGRTRKRAMTILRRDQGSDNEDQQIYVHFSQPADVNRTSFLVWKKARGNDDRWLYLPALDQVRRIAASDERTSFVGSHFFYEDVSGRSPFEDRHELTGQDGTYYILKSTPKSKRGVEFDHFVSYIEKNSMIPVRVEYYRGGKVYRRYDALKVSNVQGKPTVTRARMADQSIGGSTEVRYSKVRYDVGLDGSVFAERSLRTPPRQYLR